MDIHKNARLTPHGREHMVNMVLSGQTPKAAGEAVGVCPRTVRKWVERYQSRRPGRPAGPQLAAAIGCASRRRQTVDRAHRSAAPPAPDRQGRSPPRPASRRPPSAASSSAWASIALSALEPAEPVRRYEREQPGELIHIDIKKLGKFNRIGHRITGDRTGQSNSRGVGWEFVHVCIDDASRIAFSRIMPDERKAERRRLPQGRRRLLRKPRRHRRARHDRQRLLLQILRLPQGLPRARPQAHPHQALHAQDQRQGRALHPDRLARMGLCPRLSTPQTSAPPSCPSGSIATTGIDLMAVSAPSHPSADSA